MEYVIGLGGNLGSREGLLQAGVERLVAMGAVRVVALSDLYESEPVGPVQPRYLNAAARVTSALEPEALLQALLAVERLLGRERRERWGARTLDLDVLWAEQVVDSSALQVPHPRLAERWFALLPLLQVAPELAPEYAVPAIHGGRRLRALSLEPRAELLRADRDTVRVLGRGLDAADALAAACSAVGRALWPAAHSAADEPELVRVACAEPVRGLVAILRARQQDGLGWHRVVIDELGASALLARVLGIAERSAAAGTLADGANVMLAGADSEAVVELAVTLAPAASVV